MTTETTQVHDVAPWPSVHLGLPRARSGTAGLSTVELDHSARMAAMRAGDLGSVHSWELVTAVDGPGTRMTVFLSGCPLRCLYCHNPDTLAMKDGEPVLAEELLARVARYRGIFSATGGGLTLSGGEVLMQPAFAARVLRGAKELGVHTTLDTSGFLGANATDAMLEDTDLVLLDIKSGDEETYRRVTGCSRSTRWPATSGPSWVVPTSSTTPSRRRPRRPRPSARCSGPTASRPTY